jgi:hypothetical protein
MAQNPTTKAVLDPGANRILEIGLPPDRVGKLVGFSGFIESGEGSRLNDTG